MLKEWIAHNVMSQYAMRYITLLDGKAIDSTNDYLIKTSPTRQVREAGYVAAGITGRKTKSNRTFTRSKNAMGIEERKRNENNEEAAGEGSKEIMKEKVQEEEGEREDIKESEEKMMEMMVLVNVEGEKVWMLKVDGDDVLVWRPMLGKSHYVEMSRVTAIDPAIVDNKEKVGIQALKKILKLFNEEEDFKKQNTSPSKWPKSMMRFKGACDGKRKRNQGVAGESDNEIAERPSKHRFLFICFSIVFVLKNFAIYIFFMRAGRRKNRFLL